jgi:WD40 repeat protein
MPRHLAFRSVRILVTALFCVGGLAVCLSAGDGDIPEAITLKGHTEAVYAVAFTADGKQVVTGSFDKTLKVWDAASGKELKTFGGPKGHQNLVLSLSLSPDGSLLASGGSDNTAKIWDFPTGRHLREFACATAVNAIALSPDGTKLASVGQDGSATVFNAANGKELFSLTGHTGAVTGVCFSANGQALASCGADKTLRFWNPANGQPVAVVGAHAGTVNALALSPNNNAVYTAGADGMLKFWALPPVPSRALAAPHGDAVTAVALSADGSLLVSASADKTVRVSNFANGEQVRTLTDSRAPLQSLAIAPNGAMIAAGTADHKLFVWHADDGKLLSQVRAHEGPVTSVAFNAASNQMLTAGGDGLLKAWSVPVRPTRILSADDAAVHSVAVSPDGKTIYAACADKVVRGWTPASSLKPDRHFTGHTAAVNAVALSPNGQLLASAGDDETVRVWNPANGQQTEVIGAHAGPVTSLAFHPSGRQLLSASTDGSLKLWQLAGQAPKLYAHMEAVTSAVLSADGTRLLTGSADKLVRLWKLADGHVERTFAGNTLAVRSVALSADSTHVAAGGADRSLTVWTAADAKEVKKFAKLPAAVRSVAFSPDGKFVAAGLADNSLRLFDLAKGEEVKAFPGHRGAVTAVAFTPKGDQIVSASTDRTVQLWDIADGTSKATLRHGAAVRCLALNKDGSKAVSGGADKTIKVWTLTDAKLAAAINTPADVRSVCFNADATRLAAGGADNKARVYGADGKMQEVFAHEAAVQAVAFHGDGQRIFTASADKTAKAWTTSLLWQANHAGPVRQVVFRSTGDRVLSASDDRTVQVWNAADGKLVKILPAHDGPVTGLGLSADGSQLVTVGGDKLLKVWPLNGKANGKPTVIPLHRPASAVALSPNGRRVVASYQDDGGLLVIQLFDTATGKVLLTDTHHTSEVRSLAFLADNRTVVSAGKSTSVLLSDVGVTAVLDAHAGGVAGVAFHPNGTQALSGGKDRWVKLWDLAAGKVARSFGPLPDEVAAIALSRDGALIAAAAGKQVQVWAVATLPPGLEDSPGALLPSPQGLQALLSPEGDGNKAPGERSEPGGLTLTHPAAVTGLSFSADRTRLATSATDGWTRVWDTANGHEIQSFRHSNAVHTVAFHPRNNAVLVAGGADKTVHVHTTTLTRLLGPGPTVHGLAVTPNGSHVLAAGADRTVKMVNAGNGTVERTFLGAEGVLHAVAVSPNGILLATGGTDQTVRLYSLSNAKLLTSFKAPGPIRSLAFSPNNQSLAAACEDRMVQTWNVAYNPSQPPPADFGKPTQSFGHAGPVANVAFGADSVSLYSASADKTIKLWKLSSAGPVKSFGHPNLVDGVAFSPNGAQLATGCHDGKVRVHDVAKGQMAREINAHPTPPPGSPPGTPPGSPVYCVAWSLDGKQVLSGSNDRSLKLWDATSGNLVREFKGYDEKASPKGHQDGVYCLAFSPDGTQVASGSSDRTLKVWNVADGTVALELINPNLKPAPGQPAPAHPGRIYGVRYTPDGKALISAGSAPRNAGYLAVWNAADGQFLRGQELPLGNIFALALSPNGKELAIGTSGAGKPTGGELNSAFVLKLPAALKVQARER